MSNHLDLIKRLVLAVSLSSILFWGCSTGSDQVQVDNGPNPFLDQGTSKEDTGYVNIRGVEAHVTIEADVEADSWRIFDAPAELAQFAVTYLRDKKQFYLEILAEDTTASDRVEWLVDGEWLTSQQAAQVDRSKLRRFRMKNVNSVVLNSNADQIQAGKVYEAKVPVNPYKVMEQAGDRCAEPDSHISLSQSIYWYLWDPDRSTCDLATQIMTVTVSEVLPRNPASYPEYDRLWEDNRLDVVVLFGKLDDGAVKDDYNWQNVEKLSEWLTEAGFVEEQDPPMGRRFRKTSGEKSVVVDIYGPDLFESVADYTRLANWQKAVKEHEVVMYNGHSVLGTGMAFERAEYPGFYQIFQVASCLSYEYYVRPVLAGKGGWENVDIVSNVEPTYYSENLPLTSTILARLIWGFENDGRASWQDIMEAVSSRLGHSRFGVSGARDNCFSPSGNRCESPDPDPGKRRYEKEEPVQIPDNDPSGASSVIEVPDDLVVKGLDLEIDLSHTYTGDLRIVLSHNGVDHTVWERSGGSNDDIRETFSIRTFDNTGAAGAWTLKVMDLAGWDTGTLNRWALVVNTGDEGSSEEHTYTRNAAANIPDADETGIQSTMEVADSYEIGTLVLDLDITHTYVGDLKITLTHGGDDWVVWDREGGGADDIKRTFTTDRFNGKAASGAWTLRVSDHAGRDLGTLNTWKLVITEAL